MQQYYFDKGCSILTDSVPTLALEKPKHGEYYMIAGIDLTVRMGNRLYAHKKKMDEWLKMQKEFIK